MMQNPWHHGSKPHVTAGSSSPVILIVAKVIDVELAGLGKKKKRATGNEGCPPVNEDRYETPQALW